MMVPTSLRVVALVVTVVCTAQPGSFMGQDVYSPEGSHVLRRGGQHEDLERYGPLGSTGAVYGDAPGRDLPAAVPQPGPGQAGGVELLRAATGGRADARGWRGK